MLRIESFATSPLLSFDAELLKLLAETLHCYLLCLVMSHLVFPIAPRYLLIIDVSQIGVFISSGRLICLLQEVSLVVF